MHHTRRITISRQRGSVVLLLIFAGWGLFGAALTHIRDRSDRPDRRQQIAAVLVSWGFDADGLASPTSARDIETHLKLLQSPLGEQRVRAAWWLADHGVRRAGPVMVAAMNDPATLRPCQLAHNLGRLGDERWVSALAAATRSSGNGDLLVCATDALGDLGSADAIDALIDVYHGGFAAARALEALGEIADPSSVQFLESVAQAPRNDEQQRAAQRALERVRIMSADDPVPSLLECVKRSHGTRWLDAWAMKKLAGLQDRRAVPAFIDLLRDSTELSESDRILLAAALLAHGNEGVKGLESLAGGAAPWSSAAVAGDALLLMDKLPDESTPATKPTRSDSFEQIVQTLPASRGGQDLLGQSMPMLDFDRWINSDGNQPLKTTGSVTLYRWWTNECLYCEASLPAVEMLRQRYAPRGLRVVAVYHPKPPREISDEDLRASAARLGYNGVIALDQDWSELKNLYLSTGDRSATSASFLVDRRGIIRFVHPGPAFFPSQRPDDAVENDDFRLLEEAIRALLEEP